MLNSGNCAEFPVAPQAPLAHDPGHDSGKIQRKAKAKAKDAPAKLAKGVIAVAPPSFRRERALIKRGVWPVAGCDEAGRGPLAGPVVAAAVVLDPRRIPKGIDDSKRLTAERREELFEEICATASFAVAFGSPARIDRDNILRASLWALARAVQRAAGNAEACLRRRPRPARYRLRLRRRDRRRRAGGVDRGGLDHRQGDARPPDVRAGAGLPGLRFRTAQGLQRARASGGAATGSDPPCITAACSRPSWRRGKSISW